MKNLIYYYSIENVKNEYDKYYDTLSNERKVKCDRYKFDKDKYSCLFSYVLLRYALKQEGIDLERYSIKEGEHGKPYLKDSNIYFNISHSETYVMVGISDSEIGIDIEKKEDKHQKLASRFFTEEECDLMQSMDDFYHLWTLKEAYFKCIGTGLTLPLNSIDFSKEMNKMKFKKIMDERNYFFFTYPLQDYVISICTTNDNEIEIKEIKEV